MFRKNRDHSHALSDVETFDNDRLLPVNQGLSGFRRFRFAALAVMLAGLLTTTGLLAWPDSMAFQVRFDQDQVITLAYADEGDILVTGHADGSVAIRDADDGSVEESFQAHRSRVYQLAAQMNGDLVATGSLGKDNVKLWDMDSGNHVADLLQYDETFGLAFSPDNQLLLTSGASGGFTTLDLWDLNQKRKLRTLGRFKVDDLYPAASSFRRTPVESCIGAESSSWHSYLVHIRSEAEDHSPQR
jgi:WD40 repeat protein